MFRTKLNRPSLFKNLLWRPHLIERLEEGSHLPLILVVAPPGHGKSILISQWIEEHKTDCAWLSLDEAMNDTAIFLSYFAEAIEKLYHPEILGVKDLVKNFHFLDPGAFIEFIINKINSFHREIRLVLDDYHFISNPDIHNLINALINENIGNFKLIIISHKEPPLQLVTARLYAKILEFKMPDLRFDEDEITELLRLEPTNGSMNAEVKELLNKAEGWILGIKILQMSGSLNKPKAELEGYNYLAKNLDILLNHINHNQDPDFFKKAQLCSLCNQFNTELIDSIFGGVFEVSDNASVFLTKLKDSNFFIIPLDKEGIWYRFHHLIQDLLKTRLKQSDPDLLKTSYLNISSWFSGKGFIDEAIHYAILAENYSIACNLISKNRMRMLNLDQWWVVQTWLGRIPGKIRKNNVDLLLAQLWICQDTWELKDVSSILDTLEILGIPDSNTRKRSEHLYHIGHHYIFIKTDPKRALDYLEESKSLYQDERMFGARRELFLAVARQMLGKSDIAMCALNLIEKQFGPKHQIYTRANMARVFVHLLSGDNPQAEKDAEKLLFTTKNSDFEAGEAISLYLYGNIAFQTCNEITVIQSFRSALSFEGKLNYRLYFDTFAALVLCNSLKGNEGVAESLLQQMSEKALNLKDTSFQKYYQSVRARVKWSTGRGDSELRWAQIDWVKQYPGSYLFIVDVPELTKIRIIVSHGSILQVKEALNILAKVEAFLAELHNSYHTIDINLLKAIALLRIGNKELAGASLKKALLLADKANSLRAIIEIYQVMPSLFDMVDESYNAQRVLSRMSLNTIPNQISKSSAAKSDSISPREQEIILLIAEGLQNKEIADQLCISVLTVKKHLTNIYRKLEVPNRTSMLKKVQTLRLLPQ